MHESVKSGKKIPLKKIKLNPFNVLLVALSLGVLFFYIFFVDGAAEIYETVKMLKREWLLAGVLLMAVFWLLEALCLHMPLTASGPKLPFSRTFSISMIGQYFNSITPFSTGGQPMQAFYLSRDGVPVGASLSAMLVKLTVYQFVLTAYTAVILLFKTAFFFEKVNGFVFLTFLGFGLNVVVIAALICMGYFKRVAKVIGAWLVRVGAALHLVKDRYSALRGMTQEVDRFHKDIALLRRDIPLLFKMMALTALQLTAYFAVTYTVYRSFGLSSADFLSIISAQAFVLLLSSCIPLPGAVGASEGGFLLFFAIFFPKPFLVYAVLAWRLTTFYMPLVVGAGFTLLQGEKKENA